MRSMARSVSTLETVILTTASSIISFFRAFRLHPNRRLAPLHLKRDIDLLRTSYSCIILFGIDKNLIHTVRIESIAKKETKIVSTMNLRTISSQLTNVGVVNFISNKPTSYLCNEAYWHLLRKFHGNAVLIHIPSSKNASETLMEKLRMVFTTYLTDK